MKKVHDKGKDKGKSAQVIREKKQLEFNLAEAIRDQFDKGVLRRELNEMVWMSSVIAPGMAGFDKVWLKNSWIGVIQRYQNIEALEKAAFNGMVKAEHCGDWIRVFGEIAEETPSFNLERELFQRHYYEFWDKQKSVDKHMPMVERGSSDPGTRARLGTSHSLGEISPEMQQKINKFGSIQQSSRKVHFRSLEARSAEEMHQIGGGMKVWSPQERDILYRIEVAFGLRVGATISGTTTDTLYFLKSFGGWLTGYMDPIFYLLPIATIAAAGHHSLIEVAMPLALWGLVDYTIGSYTTLMPTLKSDSAGAPAIRKILREYEEAGANRRILVYFLRPEVPSGYWEFEAKDFPVFEAMARADKHLMRQFSAMPKPYLDELALSKWYRNARRGNPRAPI